MKSKDQLIIFAFVILSLLYWFKIQNDKEEEIIENLKDSLKEIESQNSNISKTNYELKSKLDQLQIDFNFDIQGLNEEISDIKTKLDDVESSMETFQGHWGYY